MSTRLPKNDQGLQYGYTTGSCAAAASAAAVQMLLTGAAVTEVRIDTPKGIPLVLDIEQISMQGRSVRCAVKKDAGDDPDITNGIDIYAVAEFSDQPGVQIRGGIGVGTVTRPGLDQPVGEAAINHVPREMITREVERVMHAMDADTAHTGICITIEIPDGVALAAKTFNPRLGIEGGLSVLGTSGIVEPMSEDALKRTIRAELSMRRAEGNTRVVLVPGNYGLDFLRESYKIDAETAVKCSNYIGDAVDMAGALGFTELLLVGHIGKLVKLSGGIFQTHSRQADARIDLLVSAGVRAGVAGEVLRQLFDAVTTEDALQILDEHQALQAVMVAVKERAAYYLRQRAGEQMQTRVVLFSNRFGEL